MLPYTLTQHPFPPALLLLGVLAQTKTMQCQRGKPLRPDIAETLLQQREGWSMTDRQHKHEVCASRSSIQVTRSSGALLSCQRTRSPLLPSLQPQRRGLCKASRDVASQLSAPGPCKEVLLQLPQKGLCLAAPAHEGQVTSSRKPASWTQRHAGKAAAAQHSSGFVVWREGEGLGKGEEGGKGKSVFLTRCRRVSWAIWSPAASRSLKERKAAKLRDSYRLG